MGAKWKGARTRVAEKLCLGKLVFWEQALIFTLLLILLCPIVLVPYTCFATDDTVFWYFFLAYDYLPYAYVLATLTGAWVVGRSRILAGLLLISCVVPALSLRLGDLVYKIFVMR